MLQVLEKGRSAPQAQSEYGAVYTPDCYMSFMIQTLEPETTVSMPNRMNIKYYRSNLVCCVYINPNTRQKTYWSLMV
jgi:hypothetical protein